MQNIPRELRSSLLRKTERERLSAQVDRRKRTYGPHGRIERMRAPYLVIPESGMNISRTKIEPGRQRYV